LIHVDKESIAKKKALHTISLKKKKEEKKWRRHRSSSTDGQVAPARNTIRHMYACIHVYVQKKSPNESYVRAYSFIYEEGKEKEKMLFFFSALRAVVHLEKAISEPAITIQKEMREREREKEVLLVHEPREEKREYKHEREREKKSDHKNK